MPEWINATNTLLALIFCVLLVVGWRVRDIRTLAKGIYGLLELAKRHGDPEPLHLDPLDEELDDEPTPEDEEIYERARALVIAAQKASTSYLQRRLGLGYARSARTMDLLEDRGVIGPGDGAAPRKVLLKK